MPINFSELEALLIGDTTLEELPGKAGGGSGGDSEEVTVSKIIPLASLASEIPDQGTPYTGDGTQLATDLGFKSFRWKKLFGSLAELSLTYGWAADGSAGSTGDGENPATPPDDEVWGTASGIEIPLPRHPNFETTYPAFDGDAMADHWDDNLARLVLPASHAGIALGMQGMSSFVVGSYQVTHIEYFLGSPTTIQGTVGTKAVPPGEAGTADNWLVISGGKREPDGRSPFGQRTLVYLYSEDPGFPDIVYS